MNVMTILGLFIFVFMVALILAHRKNGWVVVNKKPNNKNKFIFSPQYQALPFNTFHRK